MGDLCRNRIEQQAADHNKGPTAGSELCPPGEIGCFAPPAKAGLECNLSLTDNQKEHRGGKHRTGNLCRGAAWLESKEINPAPNGLSKLR